MSGHWTVTDALASAEPSFVVVMWPVLLTTAQLVLSVPLVMWTVPLTAVLPGMSKPVQVKTCGLLPAMAQLMPVPVKPLMLHRTPETIGRSSLTVTPVAAPAVLLPHVRSNPIGEPALTGPPGLAVLPIVTAAHSTVTEPLAELLTRTF